MKKTILFTAMFASLSVATHAEGVFGNQVSLTVGYPYYDETTDYFGINTNLDFDYFLNDNIYVTGAINLEYISSDVDVNGSTISSSVTTSRYGLGAGYEMPMVDEGNRKVSVFGEGLVAAINQSVETEIFGMPMSVSAGGTLINLNAGARAKNGALLSEVALGWQSIKVEEESESDFILNAMLGYQLTESLYAGVDVSSALDFEYGTIGAKLGYQW